MGRGWKPATPFLSMAHGMPPLPRGPLIVRTCLWARAAKYKMIGFYSVRLAILWSDCMS